MGKEIEIYCLNTGERINMEGGSTPGDLAKILGDRLPFRPICAYVNNKTENLDFPLFSPKHVELLDYMSRAGLDVYIRSLCMMTYKGVRECFPGMSLRIELSISRGHYCRLYDEAGRMVDVSAEMLLALRHKLREIAQADIPFERKERPTSEVIEIFRRQGLEDKVKLLDTVRDLYTTYYLLDGLADSYYGPLAPSTGYISIFNVEAYENGFLLLGPDPAAPGEPMKPLAQPRLYKAFTDYLDFNRVIK
ncbi:MAG: nucleoside kinase, partial [Muribaculaceae bacterium]|nr:nucleoside kinase [Muribaculaceae bacterium]